MIAYRLFICWIYPTLLRTSWLGMDCRRGIATAGGLLTQGVEEKLELA